MNKQNINKLSLFLTGLEQRLGDNLEYFKKVTVTYKSGTKSFIANVVLNEGKLSIQFNGNSENIDISLLSQRLSKYAESYDSAVVAYEERGTTIHIEADNSQVKMRTTSESSEALTNESETAKHTLETSHIGNREYYIKVGQANELLREIGILGSNGKVKNDKIRKYNQIDHFVELISDMLKQLTKDNESITVLDCACGKSYLTFVLNYYIKEVLKKPCHFIGLDYSSGVIDSSRKMAQNLGYHNMEFKATDIKSYTAERSIQLVISLHACDTATDEAIALAVRNNVNSIIIVPCCHREILHQYSCEPFKHIIKFGVLKARMADIITDGMRSLLLEALGYKVSVVEYISPVETPKNLMIRADKFQSTNRKLLEEYRALKQLLNIEPTLEKLLYLS